MKQYFYASGDTQIGPVTLEQLKQATITPKTLVWYEGLAEWKEAQAIDELREIFELQPPPLSPPPIKEVQKTVSTNKSSDSKPPEKQQAVENLNGWQYFVKCWEMYAIVSGRARRKEYWYFALFSFIARFPIAVVAGAIYGALNEEKIGTYIFYEEAREWATFALWSYAVFQFPPFIAAGIRRMHDIGKSGWYILIPIHNIILLCTDSQKGSNQYGENPKGE